MVDSNGALGIMIITIEIAAIYMTFIDRSLSLEGLLLVTLVALFGVISVAIAKSKE